MDDLISRKSLLQNIVKQLGIKNEDYFTAQESVVVSCIYNEPSAQPEQTDCYYCHEDNDGFVVPIEKNCHAAIHFDMYGWHIALKAKGWAGRAPINFCPMCGRRLNR